ncbi:hypothetical protein MBLNU230_g0215t1 [Neophaeotheca triangularis]
MPPPSKRRKLSSVTEEYIPQAEKNDLMGQMASHPHQIEHPPLAEPTSQSRRVEEVHLEIRNVSPGGSGHKHYRRQGTAASTDDATAIGLVTVSVAVDELGATVAQTTISPGTNIGVFPTTSTTTLTNLAGPPSTLASTESAQTPTSLEPSTLPASGLPSDSSDVAIAVASVSSPVPGNTSSDDAIPTDSKVPVVTSSASADLSTASEAALTSSSSSGIEDAGEANSTTSIVTSTGLSGSGSADVAILLASVTGSSASNSLNQSAFATTFSDSESSTPIDSSTISVTGSLTSDSASSITTSASASASASVSESDSSSLPFGVFLATLRNGREVTLTQSSEPYETTFSGGQVSTIPAYTSSNIRSSPLSTITDGDQTSTVYSTITNSGENSGPSTITSVQIGSDADAGAVATGGAPPPVSSATASATSGGGGSSNNDDTPPTPVLAGGVVGGVAGLAVVVLLALFFIRWYRRRGQLGQHQALPSGAVMSPEPDADLGGSTTGGSSRNPGMAERAGLMPLAGAAGFFRHFNRSSEQPAEPAERGFTRVSGRKLPSAFSEGMSSHPSQAVPLSYTDHDRNNNNNMSNTSFYHDSAGSYDGEGDVPTTPNPFAEPEAENITLSPGPQRKPTIRNGGPYSANSAPMSPPGSAERGSRFTEQV